MRSRISERVGGKAAYEFDTMSDVERYIDIAPVTWSTRNSRTTGASQSWDLKAGYDGAAYMAREGWLEGAQRMQEALEVFVPRDPAPDCVTDFYGHLPHVPRFCAGAPDNMIRHAPRAAMGSGRVLTLYVSIVANWATEAEHMMNYGAAICQYINQLEQQGLRVELYAIFVAEYYTRGPSRVSWTVRLKLADQPLDLAAIAFAIGHPAMLRRICFALIERSAAAEQAGYGKPQAAKLSDIMDPPAGSYVLNGMDQASEIAQTPAMALEYVREHINTAMNIKEDE